MKNGCAIYPNIGVKIDPRAITSLWMPESLKVYSGYLGKGYFYIISHGILKQEEFRIHYKNIRSLPPLNESNSKEKSSYFFASNKYLIEFLRTSQFNYKIYILKIPEHFRINSSISH